jgi:hypothetical protein
MDNPTQNDKPTVAPVSLPLHQQEPPIRDLATCILPPVPIRVVARGYRMILGASEGGTK